MAEVQAGLHSDVLEVNLGRRQVRLRERRAPRGTPGDRDPLGCQGKRQRQAHGDEHGYLASERRTDHRAGAFSHSRACSHEGGSSRGSRLTWRRCTCVGGRIAYGPCGAVRAAHLHWRSGPWRPYQRDPGKRPPVRSAIRRRLPGISKRAWAARSESAPSNRPVRSSTRSRDPPLLSSGPRRA